MAPFCRLVLCHCSRADVEKFGALLVPPGERRRRWVVLGMVTMGIGDTMGWEMEQQRPGSCPLLWLAWMQLLPGRTVRDGQWFAPQAQVVPGQRVSTCACVWG